MNIFLLNVVLTHTYRKRERDEEAQEHIGISKNIKTHWRTIHVLAVNDFMTCFLCSYQKCRWYNYMVMWNKLCPFNFMAIFFLLFMPNISEFYIIIRRIPWYEKRANFNKIFIRRKCVCIQVPLITSNVMLQRRNSFDNCHFICLSCLF